MAITFITPHQRANSGGVYVIEQLARHAAALTEVHVVVAKGEPKPIDGVTMHDSDVLASGRFPPADVLLIPADLRHAHPLFDLAPECGAPMLLLQGFGIPGDPVVHGNLELASHCVCMSSWLVAEARQAGCTATLLRHGLDREIFFRGPPPESRGPVVSMMTHPLDWKGTEDGLAALRIARAVVPEVEVRLFGKADPEFDAASFLASPNEPREVAALLRESAVFVCSSWEEGLGLPGLEAIASGAALATTDTKGSRDYADHMHTALVTAPHDPSALGQSIVDLIRQPDLRRKLVENGQTRIDAVYPGWDRAAELLIANLSAAATALRSPFVPASALRARQELNEAQVERAELEADLTESRRQATGSRRRVRELEGKLIDQHEARAEADAALETARRSLETSQRQVQREAAARRQFESELEQVRAALESELDTTRTELQRSRLGETRHRSEVAALTSELKLAGAQRRRLQAALARARADAQIAEAERSAFERQVSELSRQIEHGAGADARTAALGPPANGDWAELGSSPAALAEIKRLPSATRIWTPLPTAEQAVQEKFRATYAALAAGLRRAPGDPDPLAQPAAADLHGMLAASGTDQDPGSPSVDVVICVHDALTDVRRCLWSLLHKASRCFRLILVNDGSAEPTSEFLAQLAHDLPAVTLIDHPDPPHGYTIAANLGLGASASDYVVFLNSDTVITYGWLERIVACGERDPGIGILGPLSNAATHQSVPARRADGRWADNPLPAWLTPDGMALLLERVSPGAGVTLPFINGFCYVIRRQVIEQIGGFDEEHFPGGYAEENDYSQRARDAGFTLAVADNAYVYHARSRSYGAEVRDQVARAGYETFLDKHGRSKIDALVKEIESDTTLDPVRKAIADATSSPTAAAAELLAGTEQRLSIAFVLPGLAEGGSGGSHSVYQEAQGLRSLGIDTRIMLAEGAHQRARAIYEDSELFSTYASVDELTDRTSDANVIVATHFKSVSAVAGVRERRGDFLPAYYIQDYEAMFDFSDSADNDEAAASYTSIPEMLLFAKTHWLCNVISRCHGVFVAKVEPSLDTDLFHAQDTAPRDGPIRVVAMVRPRTPRRQPYSTTSVLERLSEELSHDLTIATFGCSDADLRRVTQDPGLHESHLGLLRREQVADLLRRSDVFLDMSTYQAFGRTALEAMACGCTAVVPELGGVWDFAQHGTNAVTIDTCDREAAFAAVASLAVEPDRLARLKAGALEAAGRYSVTRAALSEYVVMSRAFQARLR